MAEDNTATPVTITATAVQTPIHLAVTVTVTLFVGILFVIVYLQLCAVICYGYRLISYQTVLLFDILLWAVLRLTLYSFYFYHCCELVDRLPVFFEWLLVAFPSALQFISLAILVHYFGEFFIPVLNQYNYVHTERFLEQTALEIFNSFLFATWSLDTCNSPVAWNVTLLHNFSVILLVFILLIFVVYQICIYSSYLFQNGVYERRKEMSSLNPPYRKLKTYWCLGWVLWLFSIIVFLICNVVFSVLIRFYCEDSGQRNDPLVVLRVVTLDGLFLIMGITLAVCIMIMYTTKLGKDVLEAQNVHKWKPVIFSFFLFILFASRVVYDLTAVIIIVVNDEEMHSYGFGSSWMATDMADYGLKTHYGYIVYLSILFLWEVIPTYLIVIFFRITFPFSAYRTLTQCITCRKKTVNQTTQRRHFFDNPHRYDAETEELTGSLHRSSQLSIPHLPGPLSISPSCAGYGSTSKYPYSAPSKYSVNNTPSQAYMPGTTPPQLFTTSPSFLQ